MFPKLDAVAEMIEDASIAFRGSTLYIYNMPENMQNGVVLLDDPDMPTEVDEYIPKLKKSQFRAVVRGPDFAQAMATARLVSEALNKYNYTATNGLKFLRIKPAYDPIPYPVAESDVIEVSINLWTVYIEP